MTQSKLTITATNHILPFHQLSPRDFEHLCLWLVRREGFDQAEHLGAAGSEQGRAIEALSTIEPSDHWLAERSTLPGWDVPCRQSKEGNGRGKMGISHCQHQV